MIHVKSRPDRADLIADCTCGSHGIRIQRYVWHDGDPDYYLEHWIYAFYSDQETWWDRFKKRFAIAWDVLARGYHYFNEVCFSPREFAEFREAVNRVDPEYRERYRHALELIADIAYDRDGYASAEKLGELVDELREIALEALKDPGPK